MAQTVTILYFAWLREQLGRSGEVMELPDEIRTVGALADHLRSRGSVYAKALSTTTVLRYAVNQEFASAEQPVAPGDEVALFPPVTGG